ncbi:MFS transporter [Planosporangium thailandense]|uniref:MFS transporter n=1 Tax=Planosporangium thailandense TaxID=765197 RepID=A0ABX0XZW1_9ACTN|nr:glycoside-pentoside-hexuronide (GPH):cation symporter [Planosporangium thailandense]NJC71351.1 MFS transporter [Planosporangium thailandense]
MGRRHRPARRPEVDKTSTRWGKFRPYLLFGSLPLLFLGVALFSVPGGLSTTGKLVYAYVTYTLWGLSYSFVNIPYGSLAAAMTQDPDERSRLSSSRVVSSNLTILALAAIVAPLIQTSNNLQRSLTILMAIFLVVGFGLYLWCFFTSLEQVQREEEKVGLRESLAMLGHNRPLILLSLSGLLFLGGMFTLQTLAVYYARDVLGSGGYYVVLTVAQTVGMIAAAALAPKAVESVGKKTVYILGGVVTVVGGVALAVAPGSVPVIGIVCFAVLGLGLGTINTIIWAMEADTVDYGEWRTGVRAEGTIYSVLSFTRKVGQGVGGAAAAYALGLGGYIAGARVQPRGAITTIRLGAGALTAAFVALAILIILAYPITEKVLRGMVTELAQRRAAEVPPAPGGAATPAKPVTQRPR